MYNDGIKDSYEWQIAQFSCYILAEITASNVAPIPLHSAKNTSKKVTKRSTNKFGKTTIKFKKTPI